MKTFSFLLFFVILTAVCSGNNADSVRRENIRVLYRFLEEKVRNNDSFEKILNIEGEFESCFSSYYDSIRKFASKNHFLLFNRDCYNDGYSEKKFFTVSIMLENYAGQISIYAFYEQWEFPDNYPDILSTGATDTNGEDLYKSWILDNRTGEFRLLIPEKLEIGLVLFSIKSDYLFLMYPEYPGDNLLYIIGNDKPVHLREFDNHLFEISDSENLTYNKIWTYGFENYHNIYYRDSFNTDDFLKNKSLYDTGLYLCPEDYFKITETWIRDKKTGKFLNYIKDSVVVSECRFSFYLADTLFCSGLAEVPVNTVEKGMQHEKIIDLKTLSDYPVIDPRIKFYTNKDHKLYYLNAEIVVEFTFKNFTQFKGYPIITKYW